MKAWVKGLLRRILILILIPFYLIGFVPLVPILIIVLILAGEETCFRISFWYLDFIKYVGM